MADIRTRDIAELEERIAACSEAYEKQIASNADLYRKFEWCVYEPEVQDLIAKWRKGAEKVRKLSAELNRLKDELRYEKDSRKVVPVPGTMALCILRKRYDGFHDFQLLKKTGEVVVESSCFGSMEKAAEAAERDFPGVDYEIVDLTEKFYLGLAAGYLKRIKKLKPSFRKSAVLFDFRTIVYDRSINGWYTYFRFYHNGKEYEYRESSPGCDGIELVWSV